MTALVTVPFTIAPEAASRVAELGMQAELDRMLEHTCQAVPGLRRIDVVLAPPYDSGDEPGIIIEATKDDPQVADDPTGREWGAWMVDTFSADVCRYFVMLMVYETGNAR